MYKLLIKKRTNSLKPISKMNGFNHHYRLSHRLQLKPVSQLVVDEQLVSELSNHQIKFEKSELIFTVKSPSGINTTAGVIFLEE